MESEDRVSLHPLEFRDAVRGLLGAQPKPVFTEVKPGDSVEVRNAFGGWHRTVARSVPRLDYEHAFPRRNCWLSIAVDHPGFDHPVNWPAEDVRPMPADEPS